MAPTPVWTHFDLTAATGAPKAVAFPAAYAFEAEKRQHVLYLGEDDHIHELAVSIGQSGWSHYDLTAATGAPALSGVKDFLLCGYAFAAEQRQHVFYRGTDNHLHELAISIGQDGWSHYDLTEMAGAPALVDQPCGYAFAAEKRQHVFYKGEDQHLHELAISIGQDGWSHYDLTAATGAPAPQGPPCGYAFEAEKRQHVFYRGEDGHVHELAVSIGQDGWSHYDLTAATGAPPVSPRSMLHGYPFEAEKRQHVLYYGTDGHLHELAISFGEQGWGHYDLTLATSAPPPAPANVVPYPTLVPAGYAFEAEKRQHVVYPGTDGHLHELAISLGQDAWSAYDLSLDTGAPVPFLGLLGYAFEAERRQHLFYIGLDYHLHELAISLT